MHCINHIESDSDALRHKFNLCKDSSELAIEKIDNFNEKTYKFSNEVPVNKSFYDMGLCQYTNPYLDVDQTGRYLREYCVQRAGSNHFLHLRNLTDLRSQNQQTDPEKLMVIFKEIAKKEDESEEYTIDIDPTELPYDVAYKWSEANKAMSVDRKQFLRQIHREMKYMCPRCRIAYIENLEQIANELDEVTVTWTNYLNSDDVEKDYLEQYMSTMPKMTDDEESWEYWEEIMEPIIKSDGLDRKNSTNPYSTNRLFNGTEALTPEFQNYIENADIDTIKKLQSRMFPQKRSYQEIEAIKVDFKAKYGTTPCMSSTNPRMRVLWTKCTKNMKSYLFRSKKPLYDDYGQLVKVPAVSTGLKYKPPYYHYFTSEMISHFWTLIKLRKEKLNEEIVEDDDLSENAMIAIGWIRQLGKSQITTMLINNAIQGQKINVYGIKVDFSHELDQKEANTLWQTYKSM